MAQPPYVVHDTHMRIDKNNLCYKCNKEIDVPVAEDGEFVWITKMVLMINKKYCKIRVNINSNIKGQYFGE
jgi:hypothetical protein